MSCKKRIICTLALAALILTLLCACGKESSTFTVKYVGTANVLSPVQLISGEYKSKEMKLSLKEAFKGYSVTNVEFAEKENVTMKGTEDGGICYVGGVIITLEDDNGNSVLVTAKEGSVFDAEPNGDSIYLLVKAP